MLDMFQKIMFVFNKKQKFHLFILFIIIVISTFMETVGLTAIIPFITAIMLPEQMMSNEYVRKFFDFLNLQSMEQLIILLGSILIVLYVFKNTFFLFMNELQYRFVFNNQHRLSYRMLTNYMSRDYLYHTAHNSAELRNNIAADVDTFFVTLLAIVQLATELFVCASILILLTIIDPIITLITSVILTICITIFARIYRKKVKEFGDERRIYSIKMNKWLDQAFGGIKEVKILNREQFFEDSYRITNSKYVKSRRKYTLYSVTPKPVLESVCIVSLLLVIIVQIGVGVDTQTFIPTLSVFAMAAIRLLPSFGKMAGLLSSIMFNKSSVDALYEDLLELERRQEDVQNKCEITDAELPFEKEINVRGMNFQYPNTEQPVLRDVNITILKNQSVAFIGPSGAGKTTLADIILGLLEPQQGIVIVDGINVFEHLDAWHKKLGYIPQNIYLMDDTIRKNIAFGKNEDEILDDEIWEALEGAQLAEFVKTLELGLDTNIGERGILFSGGQRQRLGIARALYYNAEILVLDEATSALDNETEKAVMDAIEHLAGKKTMIIIAHRLTTIENCDIIYQVKDREVTRQNKVSQK